jgi:hypothetical protein
MHPFEWSFSASAELVIGGLLGAVLLVAALAPLL